MPAISFLECSRCHRQLSAATPRTVCPACSGTLYVRYDLDALKKTAKRPGPGAVASMWRYVDVLPDVEPVTLGEGWTPMLPSRRHPGLFVKEEASNPTGSLHARGMSVAVSTARQYGLKKLAAFSADDAASALAAYSAAAGIEAHIFIPRDLPMANYVEAKVYGPHVIPVDGQDYRRVIAERKASEGWFDLSALKEPFRAEGEKTMGYELVEQLGWTYPDAVFCPPGDGAELIGIWKAFEEMEHLGWVSGKRPKMIAVQTSGGAPAAHAPNDSLMLEIIRESGGTVVDVPDQRILPSLLDWARHEGLFLCPEGASATAACDQLIVSGFLKKSDRVVLFNTGSGLRHIEAIARAMQLEHPDTKHYPQRTPIGGIITPQ